MRHKSPIWKLGRWEPPEYIEEEKWYKLEVEGCKLIGAYAVSDHGRVYSYTSESIISPYFVKGYAITRLRIATAGKITRYAIYQQKLRQLIKQRRLKAGDTLVYPMSTIARNKMKHDCPESVVRVSAKPEVPAARQDEPAAATVDKRVAAFPEPHHQELPWMKITPEELTVVRMMLASLEDHEAVHVVQEARRGLKRLLDEGEKHNEYR